MNPLLKIAGFFKGIDEANREKLSNYMEWEEEELRNIFSLLVFGSFVGIPSPPIHIISELVPEMKADFNRMLEKVVASNDPIGELFSVLDCC